jgi:hypothetical protein
MSSLKCDDFKTVEYLQHCNHFHKMNEAYASSVVKLSKLVQPVTLLTCVSDFPGSSLDWDTSQQD